MTSSEPKPRNDPATDWSGRTLSELCSYINRGSAPVYVEQGGVLVLNQRCVRDYRVNYEEARRTNDVQRPIVAEKILQPLDILVNSTGVGTLGRVAQLLTTHERATVDSHITIVRPNPSVVDPRYLGYAVRSSQREIEALSEGSTGQTELSRGRLASFMVLVAPKSVQEKIASVLGALDDLIEQNLRTARIVEQLAQAIFRAWFVDYEPVRAKVAGASAFPSMPHSLFDAISKRFVESNIGPVPEGWVVKGIGDVVSTKGGGTPSTQKSEYWDGGVHCWATPRDMSRLSYPVLLDTQRHVTDEGVGRISSGLLPVGTVLMSSRAPVGYLAITAVPTAINQGIIAMVCDGPLPSTYILNWAFNSMDTIKAHASGTTFPEISKKNFRPLPIVLPTSDVITAFQHVVDPLYDLITSSLREIEHLSALRDYLLPRLLAGSLRVNQ